MKKHTFDDDRLKKIIGHVALAARQHKKVWVTTGMQIFTVEADADEAIRTMNGNMSEPDDYVGVITVTEDMVSDSALRTFGKDLNAFTKLFDNARIPRSKTSKNNTYEKKREPKLDVSEADSIATALGTGGTSAEETKPENATKKTVPFRGGK